MRHYDVFNGDADGICALHQLRLAQPLAGTLVTGVKRDVALLARVPARAGDTVTVLDISLDRNRASLLDLLARGVDIDYFDHHFAGELPVHPRLRAWIDTAAGTCTSLLVDRHLQGLHRAWAVVGAFGDNLPQVATALASGLQLEVGSVQALRELGECMNYNAYGDTLADLLVPPAQLYEQLRTYADPLAFIAGERLARDLAQRRNEDLARAETQAERIPMAGSSVHVLPDSAWARRVLGTYANVLSQREPTLAHAVLRTTAQGNDVVSVRAPGSAPSGADVLCRRFGGSGRAAAAGIDRLPRGRREEFLAEFTRTFQGTSTQ